MHPVELKIDAVRRRARRLLLVYGLSSVLGIVLLAAVAISLVDYLIKFQDHGVRVIFSLTVLGILSWAFYRFLWKSTRRQLNDVAVAQHVERQFPQLGDRLSTTVEFLKQNEDDALAGSAALRRAVVNTTTSDIESLDFSKALAPQATRRAMGWATVACLFALALVAANPLAARVAIARLVRPFGNDSWPRRNNLSLVNPPKRLAVGQTFELSVRDLADNLPEEARIHFRYDEDNGVFSDEQVEPMQRLNDVLVARRENVTRPFSYRVTGGDDHSMGWTRLEVVEPPRVESIKVTLQPPAYTGWPSVGSDRQIQALRGTRVDLSATVNKRLKSARLVQENGDAIAARVAADGHTVAVPADPAKPFIVDKSGAYWLELVDEEDLTGGTQDRWEIRAVTDAAPTVAIEQPIANQFVTPDAEIPVKILVKDDLAVRDISLRFTRSAEANVEDMQIPLFKGPDAAPPSEGQKSAVPQAGESRTSDYSWELASLALKPGTQLTFHAAVNDYLPQMGKSPERRITIISARELEDRIAQRQALILGELGRVLKLEQDTRAQVNDLQIQFDKVGSLTKQDIDHAQGAELNQRQVNRTLTGESEGLPAQIDDLLGELKSNKVDSPDVERRMNAMLDELKRLGKEHLGPIDRELTGVIKSAQSELNGGQPKPPKPEAPSNSSIAKSLDATAGHQDEVIGSLEQMLNELGQWDSYRRFGREISQLKRDQEELEEQTGEVGGKTLGKDRKDLDPQQQADLNKLAERQRELARRFDKSQQQMTEMSKSLQESDPLAAATLGDAAQQARERGVSGQMREGGKQLDDNQVGQAKQQQQQIRKELDELLDILSNRREQELSRLVKRLREAENELAGIRKQEEGLRKKIEAAKKIENPEERRRQLERLSRQQKQLQEESQRFARRLERLQAEKAASRTTGAAGKMGKSGQAGESGNADEAGEQAEQAQKDLDEAQEQLAERRKQAEADLAREQIARMQDGLKSLHDRQQSLLVETERLESLRATQGRFTRPQVISLRDLARAQKGLKSESDTLAEKLAAAEVFHLALESIGGEMARAGEAIEAQDTGVTTQGVEKDILRRIDQLLSALKTAGKPPGGQGNAGGQGGGNKAAQDSIRALAEVKLLKLMQEDLNARFQRVAEGKDKLSREARAAEFDRMSAEQGKLADLTHNFTRPPADAPEDDPEKLPDLRLEEKP